MTTAMRSTVLAVIGLLNAAAAFSSTLNVVFYDNRFGTLDDTTGAFTQVGTLPVSASAGIASMNGMLYVEDMGSELYEIDPANGAWGEVGATGLDVTAGAFAGSQDGLFEVDYSSNLFSLNPTTGQGTLIGATGLAANNGGFDTSLSSDGTYLYYTEGRAGASDELYRIDTTTGIATDLGSTGVTGIAGSAFVNGDLELFQYGQSQNYIYYAADGATDFTRGALLSAQILDGGTAINSPAIPETDAFAAVPEPATNVLGGGALLLLSFFLWRRRARTVRSGNRDRRGNAAVKTI